MNLLKELFQVLKQTFKEWNEDHAPQQAAALAYYTTFSIAPLLIIVIAAVGLVVSAETVETRILTEVRTSLGAGAADLVSNLIDNLSQPREGLLSTVFGFGALIFGALSTFNHLQLALDMMWDVPQEERKGGIMQIIKDRLLSFGMVLGIGFLLLVSLVISTLIGVLSSDIANLFPGATLLIGLLDTLLPIAIITVLFGMIFKVLPHIDISWRDVSIGAFVTAILFTIGQRLLGAYLVNSGTASAYGVAGALILVLLWIYYSAQIMFFGAEFTQVYARRYGSQRPEHEPDPSEQPVHVVEPSPEVGYVPPQVSTDNRRRTILPELVFSVGAVILGTFAGWLQGRSTD